MGTAGGTRFAQIERTRDYANEGTSGWQVEDWGVEFTGPRIYRMAQAGAKTGRCARDLRAVSRSGGARTRSLRARPSRGAGVGEFGGDAAMRGQTCGLREQRVEMRVRAEAGRQRAVREVAAACLSRRANEKGATDGRGRVGGSGLHVVRRREGRCQPSEFKLRLRCRRFCRRSICRSRGFPNFLRSGKPA